MSICHFVLVTIACAFSCKLERECQDRLGKKHFEQWLYDTAYAEVKHFHGNNGICI